MHLINRIEKAIEQVHNKLQLEATLADKIPYNQAREDLKKARALLLKHYYTIEDADQL